MPLRPSVLAILEKRWGAEDAALFERWFPVLESLANGWARARTERQCQFKKEIDMKQPTMKSARWWKEYQEVELQVRRRDATDVVRWDSSSGNVIPTEREMGVNPLTEAEWEAWQRRDREHDSGR